jgi:hypothetical protein
LDSLEFGDISEKGPRRAFCSVISGESSLNFHELQLMQNTNEKLSNPVKPLGEMSAEGA